MDEAYKLMSGDPAIDAVSEAAKGNVPLTDKEGRVKHFNASQKCVDINDAYATLFESLSVILRSK
jgi:hypothetical protein